MSKPFFYRITAADFLAAVVIVPEQERAAWVLSLALDMVSGDGDTAKSDFAKAIIAEAAEFSGKKRAAANKRWKAQDMQTDAVHSTAMPVAVAVAVAVAVPKTKNIYGIGDNVKLTLAEHDKLGEKLNGSREIYIDRLSTYDKIAKYKSHYLTILGWFAKDQEKNKNDIDGPRSKPL